MAKRRVSRVSEPNSFSCTTFNILAPIYKRLIHEDHACRESDIRAYWFHRNQRILDLLLREETSSIICLQEYWVGNEELVNMYDTRLGDAGYINFKLARTNNRGDGLLTAVHKDYFRVLDHRNFLFNDFGDRVAQLLHVQVIGLSQQILIVNTHLLFPHDSSMCLERLRQVYKILQSLEAYHKENNLTPLPIILCGDWNGSKRGHIYKFLRSQGFVSSYDTAHHYTDADAHKWVSHRNHRGNICGVDFIWLLNPNKCRKVLKTSWSDAVFGLFKYHVRRASLTEEDAFAFLKADNDGDGITYSGFCEALRQLNFIGHPNGLSKEETKDLWDQADIDGNGIVDYTEFQIWNPTRWDQAVTEEDIGYRVKHAVLYPREAEKGLWPDDYSLSDHARLTVVFSPTRLP
ncbi:putative EF-hand domain, endonuclease/exonuclease/phosphatase, EF-hand domain pair [Helianthus annuus]|nr:putative EF-hand domain, endonuclease/exonuclease/phosphatase, EF-hand domain pair [Helianthus annuus]KAJ0558951.1 putative EF-hand domain, endonuclease/exonuclease/phosphatase, EF-hand domain pair [Helianthus annuus]KAJ0564808.1 putative EF-hand domain, endonuclease/exonuclease/phosphatase, EF-hand domain pair [Helianthus annuus]KAJ0730120.1 putative EF-hand domain, endonuclease/exonuclease/phosphatase, EF-hand domain pair [Helianthus annuus]KAJ0732853.1 putative EF-hand domain, endonucleas